MADPEPWRSRAKVLSAKNRAAKEATTKARPAPSQVSTTTPDDHSTSSQEVPADWQSLDATNALEPIQGSTSRKRRRISWVEILGVVAILALLVTAFLMSRRNADVVAGQTASTKGETTRAQSESRITSTARQQQPAADPTDPPGSRKRAEAIADQVMGDAGDGSFALDPKSPNRGSNPPSPEMETNRNVPASSENPDPTSTPATSESPAIRPDKPRELTKSPRRKPRKYKPAPDPNEILALPRKVPSREPEQQLRPELSLPPRAPAYISFDRLYPDAYETHKEYSEQKRSEPDAEITRALLVECIKLFEQCRGRPHRELSGEQRFQIEFTLATLYADAGRLFEANVYATHVAGHAEPAAPVTAAAVTLAYTIFQESHLGHYGDPTSSGELRQMIKLCDLAESRSIDVSQLDKMRFGLAQLLRKDAQHIESARQFLRVPKSSDLYPQARLVAGREFWTESVLRRQEGVEQQLEEIVSSAEKYLKEGIDRMKADGRPTPSLIAGMLELSQIAARRQDPQRVVDLLSEPDGALGQLKQVEMPKAFITSVHEALFEAYAQIGDTDAMQVELDELAKRYGKSGEARITQLRTKLARDFLKDLDPSNSVDEATVRRFDSVMQSVVDPKQKPTIDVLLWASQSWSELATRTTSPEVVGQCIDHADELIVRATNLRRIDDAMSMALLLRRIDLAEQAGRTEAALDLLAGTLEKLPNAVDLQIRAAALLSAKAQATDRPEDINQAIDGRSEQSIWGWDKLSSTLIRMHFDSDDKTRYLERLLESSYQLNEARIRKADASTSPEERERLKTLAAKHLKQLRSTFAVSSEAWKDRLDELLNRI